MKNLAQRPVLQAEVLIILLLFLSCTHGCFWKKKAPEKEADAQELYREGLDLIHKKKFDEAREIFNKVKVLSTQTDLELLAQIAVADSYFEEKEYEAARAQYEEIFKLHSGAEIADYLQYRIGECFYWQIDTIDRDVTNADEALKAFNRLVENFPKSDYLSLAALRIREIQTFLAEHELFIGNFYLKKNALLAAVERFKKARDLYPESGIEDKILFYLYKAYKSLKDEDHAEQYKRLLMERYPNSEYIPRVQGIEKQGLQWDLEPPVHAAGEEAADPGTLASAQGFGSPADLKDLAMSNGPGKAWTPPPVGLAGTYQGKNKGSWMRRILFLEGTGPEVECSGKAQSLSGGNKDGLRKRSFLDKIIP